MNSNHAFMKSEEMPKNSMNIYFPIFYFIRWFPHIRNSQMKNNLNQNVLYYFIVSGYELTKLHLIHELLRVASNYN